MLMQVTAVWGPKEEASMKVATTPSDMIEAALFGAWLRDAAVKPKTELSDTGRSRPTAMRQPEQRQADMKALRLLS